MALFLKSFIILDPVKIFMHLILFFSDSLTNATKTRLHVELYAYSSHTTSKLGQVYIFTVILSHKRASVHDIREPFLINVRY